MEEKKPFPPRPVADARITQKNISTNRSKVYYFPTMIEGFYQRKCSLGLFKRPRLAGVGTFFQDAPTEDVPHRTGHFLVRLQERVTSSTSPSLLLLSPLPRSKVHFRFASCLARRFASGSLQVTIMKDSGQAPRSRGEKSVSCRIISNLMRSATTMK